MRLIKVFPVLAALCCLFFSQKNIAQTCTGNLLQNPGFESGLTNWDGGGQIDAAAQSGTKALKNCVVGSSVRQTLAATAGKTYTLNGFLKKDATANVFVFLKFLSGSFTPLVAPFANWQGQGTAWSAFEPLVWTAPANTAFVEISVVQNGGTGCVFADDFCLTIDGPTGGGQPDLTISNIITNGYSVQAGKVFSYRFDLANPSMTAIPGNFNIKAYLSTDDILSANDIQDGIVGTGNFAAGLTVPQVLGATTVPAGLAPGQYFLILKVDADNQISESNEANNVVVSSSPIEVAAPTTGNAGPCEKFVGNGQLVCAQPVANSTNAQITIDGGGQRVQTTVSAVPAIVSNTNLGAISNNFFQPYTFAVNGTTTTFSKNNLNGTVAYTKTLPAALAGSLASFQAVTEFGTGFVLMGWKNAAANPAYILDSLFAIKTDANLNIVLRKFISLGTGLPYGNYAGSLTVVGNDRLGYIFTKTQFGTDYLGFLRLMDGNFVQKSEKALFANIYSAGAQLTKNLCRGFTVTDSQGLGYCKSGGCYRQESFDGEFVNDQFVAYNSYTKYHQTTVGIGLENQDFFTQTTDGGSIKGERYLLGNIYQIANDTIVLKKYNAANTLLWTKKVRVPEANFVLKIIESGGEIYFLKQNYSSDWSVVTLTCLQNLTPTGLTVNCPADMVFSECPQSSNGVACLNCHNIIAPTATTTCAGGTTVVFDSYSNLLPSTGGTPMSITPTGPFGLVTIGFGSAIVKFKVTDNCSNVSFCSYKITNNYNDPMPVVNCPPNITVTAAAGATGAVVNYTPPTFTSACTFFSPNMPIGKGPGATFPIGTTTVLWTSTNTQVAAPGPSCTFTVTVNAPTGGGTCATNLLQNPSFENNLTNWEGVAVVSTTASAGTKSAKICQNANFRQTIATSTGKNLTLLFKAREETGTGKVLSYIKYLSNAWQPLVTEFFDFSTTTTFAQATVSKIAPANTAWVEIGFLRQTAGCVLVDEVCLSETGTGGGCANPLTSTSSIPACTDNGTPNNAADDLMVFSVTGSGGGLSANYFLSVPNAQGGLPTILNSQKGSPVNLSYNISSVNANLGGSIIVSGEDANPNQACTFTRTIAAIPTCSNGSANLPDLTVLGHTFPTTVTAGQTITANISVKNIGIAATNLPFKAGFRISSMPTPPQGGGIPIADIAFSNFIGANGTDLQSATFTLPSPFTPGNYFLFVVADIGAVIAETNESNNILTVPITVMGGTTGGADLKISITADKTTVPQWGNVTFTVTAKNEGTAPISAAVVKIGGCEAGVFKFFDQNFKLVYAGTPAPPTAGSFNFISQEWTISNLAAGAQAVLNIPLFTTGTAEKKVAAWAKSQSPTDPDSQPSANIFAGCTPAQDDEAVFTINLGQSLTGSDGRSVADLGIRNSERISPNPAGEILTLNMADFMEKEDVQVSIFDNKGLIVKDLRFEKIAFPTEEISLEGFQNGLYFVRFVAPNLRPVTVKLAVQRTF